MSNLSLFILLKRSWKLKIFNPLRTSSLRSKVVTENYWKDCGEILWNAVTDPNICKKTSGCGLSDCWCYIRLLLYIKQIPSLNFYFLSITYRNQVCFATYQPIISINEAILYHFSPSYVILSRSLHFYSLSDFFVPFRTLYIFVNP